jgi:hypothetical protein
MGNRICLTGASVIAQMDIEGNKPQVESLTPRTICYDERILKSRLCITLPMQIHTLIECKK